MDNIYLNEDLFNRLLFFIFRHFQLSPEVFEQMKDLIVKIFPLTISSSLINSDQR